MGWQINVGPVKCRSLFRCRLLRDPANTRSLHCVYSPHNCSYSCAVTQDVQKSACGLIQHVRPATIMCAYSCCWWLCLHASAVWGHRCLWSHCLACAFSAHTCCWPWEPTFAGSAISLRWYTNIHTRASMYISSIHHIFQVYMNKYRDTHIYKYT